MNVTMLALDKIGYDPKYYPRANGFEDWMTTHRYADALKADARKQFPPIHVAPITKKPYPFILLDGRHRSKAYHAAHREKIPAVVERMPESKWFARSVELNCRHGRALDTGDKAWIAVRLEHEGWSINQVADLLQMRVESLEKIKASRIVKIKASVAKKLPEGRSNKKVGNQSFGFLKAPFGGFVAAANAEEVLGVQNPVASMNVANVLDSVIAVLIGGVDMSDEDTVQRIERIRELLPEPALV